MLAESLLNVVNAGPDSKGRWQAPALSSLVSRLAQPPGKPPQPSSPSWHQPPPQADQEVFLDASSDEEDKEAASAGPGPGTGGQELNLSIYSAAAGPFKALLACVGQAPGASYLFCHAATVWIHIHMQHLLVCFAGTQNLLINLPQPLCCCCLLVFIVLQMMSQAFLHQVCFSDRCTDLCAGADADRTYTYSVVLQCILTCMHVSPSQESGQEAAQVPDSAVQSLQLSVFAGVLVTLEPLPFANAEGPLQSLSTLQQPAHHTQAAHHQAEAQAVIGQPSSGHSPAKPAAAPGKSSLAVLLTHTAISLNAAHRSLSNALKSSSSQLVYSIYADIMSVLYIALSYIRQAYTVSVHVQEKEKKRLHLLASI